MNQLSFKHGTNVHALSSEIAEVYSLAHETKGGGSRPDPTSKRNFIRDLALNNHDIDCYFVENLSSDKKPMCAFVLMEKLDDDTMYIHDICSVTQKGAGVGAQLMGVAFKKAEADNIQCVTLIAAKSSVKFYENFFFEAVGEQDGGTKMVNKNVHDTAVCLSAIYGTPEIK